MYFNTTSLTGEELEQARVQSSKQSERILAIFKKLSKGTKATASQIHKIYCFLYPKTPITSIRRAMNTLMEDGKIEKNYIGEGEDRKPETILAKENEWNKRETVWALKMTEQIQGNIFNGLI